MVLATTGTEEPRRPTTQSPTDAPTPAGNNEATTTGAAVDPDTAELLDELDDLGDIL